MVRTALCLLVAHAAAFRPAATRRRSATPLRMGIFDAFTAAFKNQDFAREDRRVRARHVLVASRERAVELRDEIAAGANIADVARRESTCASASTGGDLGSFSPGKMVPQFDQVLFPDFDNAPPAGSLLGPVETEFGFHVILVTDRNQNKDQVTELLARND